MLTLYGISASRASRNLWLLEELALPYEHKPVSFMNKGAHTPEMLALNPNGHIPVLVDDGLAVWESLAINLYLVKKFPSSLGAETIEEEAAALQWSFWVVTEVEKDALTVLMHGMVYPPEMRNANTFNEAAERLHKPLKVLESHLSTRSHMMGERFTVLDINLASVLNWARVSKELLPQYPKVSEWLARMVARPAQKKVRTLP